LLWDRRVPTILKVFIPISVSYLALPFDLVRDFIPLVGRFDDLIVLTLAMILFIRLSPPQIVGEHREAIWSTRVVEQEGTTDAEYQVLHNEEPQDTTTRRNSDAESNA
jgi:uncharacterized membrane protein YkvA (DUF1232 family)